MTVDAMQDFSQETLNLVKEVNAGRIAIDELTPEQQIECSRVVATRITRLQENISSTTAIIADEIKEAAAKINFLKLRWLPTIKQYAKNELKTTANAPKNVRFGDCKVFFSTDKAISIHDRKELENDLLNKLKEALIPEVRQVIQSQSDFTIAAKEIVSLCLSKGLEDYSFRIQPKLDSRKLLSHLTETGERLPGIAVKTADKFAKVEFGTTKKWSLKNVQDIISTSIKTIGTPEDDEAEND